MGIVIAIIIILFILYTIGNALKKAGLIPDSPDEIQEKRGHVEIIRHDPQEENISRKPIVEHAVDYSPLLELCAEIQNWHENNYLPFEQPITVEIDYCDNDGEKTHRKVDILYIAQSDYNNDEYYFKAFCHLRNEERSFKATRVLKTMANGQEVDLIQYIVDTYRKTDGYRATMLAIRTEDLLHSDSEAGTAARILTYIARIDGIFTRKEKVTIAQFIQEIAGAENGIEIENYIKGLQALIPTTPEYKKLVKQADVSDALIGKAKEMVGKDPLRQGAFDILLGQYNKSHEISQKPT
ncbi:MAG: WYL domain-containing protein [Treponema sp.]|jgi:hypothetical protein|nr:WYL domain-containing protein [Treponema sp.]